MSKRRNKAQLLAEAAKDNTISFDSYKKRDQYYNKRVELIPKTLKQEEYINLLTDPQKFIVFSTGPAGTGKTMMAVLAAIRAFKMQEINKIVVTRPAVGVDDEKHGFLPGDLNAKMEPWTRPIMDVFQEYFSPKDITRMLEEQTIELAPLAFQRGRTFKNAWVILDEAQNVSVNQMKMALTRIGDGSKMVITGDLQQRDRKYVSDNGLNDFMERLAAQGSNRISVVQFARKDVMRHPVVEEVLSLYGEE